MAYSLITTIQRWQGPDGDHFDITSASEGSTYHAVDTGAQYVFHDGGWVEDLRQIYALNHV